MPKTIRDKLTKGKLERELDKLNGDAKYQRKSELLKESKSSSSHTYKGINFTFLSEPIIDGAKLVVNIQAVKNGKNLFVDNPLIFINPPIKVPDGTYHIEQNLEGNDIEVDNFKEDPAEALKEVIYQVVKTQNDGDLWQL